MDCSINLAYIRQLIEDDPILLKDFVGDIIVQLKESDLLMQQHLEKNDFVSLAATAHKLKSSLKIVGADPLYEKLHELESLATEKKVLDEILPLYEMIQILSRSCQEKLSTAV